MCGFVGSFGADPDREEIAAALAVVAHRGPHGRQVVEQGELCLGSCRLAIVPPPQAPPVHRPSPLEVLVLNGEIYGPEPCADRPGGAAAADTERLGRLLGERGTGVLAELKGLFAFCHFDGRRLLLARDRFGIKPLYYARRRGGIVFGSEMKALLALPGLSREPDEDVMAALAVVGYNVFPGRTPFRHLRAVLPGHWVEAGANGELREVPFARVPAVPPPGGGRRLSPEEARDRVGDLLAASLRRAVRHDPHPKAVFFSGGLDSTLLLDLARSEGPVTAFVLSDREDAADLMAARRVAAALGVPLRERLIDERDLAREIVDYAWHFEHPIAGGGFDLLGGVAFHALARSVGEDFRVAFCGEGADELFLGYHRLHAEPRLALAGLAKRARERTTPALEDWLRSRELVPAGPAAARAIRDLALRQGLSEYHLPSVDRSGMAFGLEVRPPYLDNDLADLAAALDEAVLIDRDEYWTKLPLRAIARQRLVAAGTERVAVRRKWAMSSAVETAGRRLVGLLPRTQAGNGEVPESLLGELFRYLHVEPGLTGRPEFSLVEFAAEIADRKPPS